MFARLSLAGRLANLFQLPAMTLSLGAASLTLLFVC